MTFPFHLLQWPFTTCNAEMHIGMHLSDREADAGSAQHFGCANSRKYRIEMNHSELIQVAGMHLGTKLEFENEPFTRGTKMNAFCSQ